MPSVQFIVSTSDYINDVNVSVSYPYLMTFSKTEQQNSSLFPNFMFNDFESTYISFLEKQTIWSNKYDKIFSFVNDNKINDIYDGIYNIDSLVGYKYIINTYGSNMLPHSFLSGACVIIIENENPAELNKILSEIDAGQTLFVKNFEVIPTEIRKKLLERKLLIISGDLENILTKDEVLKFPTRIFFSPFSEIEIPPLEKYQSYMFLKNKNTQVIT